MGLIKLFYNLIHVKQIVKNNNSVSVEIIEDTLENVLKDICFCYLRSNLAVVLYFVTLHDKHNMHRLSVKINFICTLQNRPENISTWIYVYPPKSIELFQ